MSHLHLGFPACVVLCTFAFAQDLPQPIRLTVRLPKAAQLDLHGVTIDGGEVREIVAQPVSPDGKSTYTFIARWTEGGQSRTAKRSVTASPGESVEVKFEADDLSADEKQVVELTNRERAKAGLPALRVNLRLMRAARLHTLNMAAKDTLNHTLDGKQFSDRVKDAGYTLQAGGENIAQYQPTPAEALASWMQSPGHRANILSRDYTEIGVGVAATRSGQKYYTQVFARPFQ